MNFTSGFPRAVTKAVVPGGADGVPIFVPGALNPADDLISVHHVSADLTTNDDLTAEFSIVAGTNNRISNAALGTDTTGDWLIVVWARAAGT